MRHEESFGVIPLSRTDGEWKVFLIRHKHGRYWGFPKGHGEGSETPQESALRELKEETNLELVRLFLEEPFVESYSFILSGRRIFKKVSYFIAEVGGDVQLQQEEIQDGIWLPLPEALEKVTHREGKAILRKIDRLLKGIPEEEM